MKLKHFIISVFLLTLISCEQEIKLENHINKSENFNKHIIMDQHPVTGVKINDHSEIIAGSEKWKDIIEWCQANKSGWTSASPASYIGELQLSQEDFSLFFLRKSEFVVLSLTNQKGNVKQYKKTLVDESWMLLMDN